MKYFASAFLIVVISFLGYSQTYEVGAIVGGTNFIGDVGKTNFIAPNDFAFGGIVKWNRSTRHAFRVSVISANVQGNDSESNESRRRERGYSFQNKITEISGGIEYTFWDYKIYSGRRVSTPYLYTGLTYFLYKAAYITPEKKFRDYDQAGAIAIPMVLGYKAKLSDDFAIALEIGARYTFTDDIDGSNPVKGLANSENLKFGNVNNNDWYVFTGVNFNFTFGRKPCYCNF